jgi:GDP-L-fucose synthase
MKVYVAGHKGMVGSAICRQLGEAPGVDLITRPRAELDLLDTNAVRDFFNETKPEVVILAAAKVGGIHANNTYPADFIYENLQIQNNVIHQAHVAGVNRLLFLGSSCIYPKFAQQPIREDELMNGALEATNEPYAIAKIAGIKMCESYNRQYGRDYRSVMPTNLYGPGDNFHPINSHVVPALMRRFHEAKLRGKAQVEVWGSGAPMREFLFVDDMASASIFVMNLGKEIYSKYSSPMLSHINVGTGTDVTIRELATSIREVVGFSGEIVFNPSQPDGTPRKLLDVGKLSQMGWNFEVSLRDGLERTYKWFLENFNHL